MNAITHPMTVEAYERLVSSDPDRKWELHDGQLREKPGMSWEHLDIVTLLSHLLQLQLDRREFRVFAEGRVRRPEATVFIPDILVVPAALGPRFRGQPGTLAIFPDPLPLIVEVWFQSTGDHDVDAKLPIYQQRDDREIWRIHPYERTLTAWRLLPDGTYDETVYRDGDVRSTALPGVSIRLAELFDD
jgi:Uma2 family endonuclease